jgi:NADH-quinone oxidoreductase subunit N
MELALPSINLIPILPQIIVVGAAILVLLLDLVWANKKGLGLLSLAGVVGAGVAAVLILPAPLQPAQTFQNMAAADRFSLLVTLIVAGGAALAILISLDYAARLGIAGGEYYGLLLLAAAGMMFLGAATHLMTMFIAVEILSLSLYVLAGLNRREVRSGESALKYLLLGGFASAFLLYGMALIYGATGSLSLLGIRAAYMTSSVVPPLGNTLLLAGLGMLIIGFAFKIAAVPFHMWTPDVYQGAPTSVTAFMAVGAKAAGFAALLRLLATTFAGLQSKWLAAIVILAVLTMTWGNLAAIVQRNVKRMLAYSSIAHAGYLLVGVAAGGEALTSVLFYLAAYTLMNVGAFAVLSALERDAAGATLDSMRGLFRRNPWLAAAMTIFMLSLAGVPPLAGFLGKLYIFSAAIKANLMWLAIVGVINSVISAYYYLRVVAHMAMEEPAGEPANTRGVGLSVGTALAALGTVVVGLWPAPLLLFLQVSAAGLL